MEMQEYTATTIKKSEGKRNNRTENLSPITGIIFILFISTLYGIVHVIDDILPAPLYIEDEAQNPERFVSERAQNSLKKLIEIGPRVTGSDSNEIHAVKFLRLEIAEIIENAHKNQKIEYDQQLVSGKIESSDDIHIYENIQNVVVKVHGQKYSQHSLLINVHFDSAPTSPGGSDDGINCAIALEALRKLAKSSITYSHNIIFLFNGGEEMGLLGAQGFITHHRWAREVKVFINLEANGVGGKLLLFQTAANQSWLLKYFSKVALPHAQVAAEELYQYRFLPYDTDFTVFTEVGKIIGLDFAFIKNPQRYHTRFDNFDIPLRSYQHAGDIVLNLIRNLANATEISENPTENGSKNIYYDFLGLFLIHYTKTVGITINILCSIISFLITFKSFYDFRITLSLRFLKYLSITFIGLAFGWILAGIFAVAIVHILTALDYNLIWYGNSWIISGLYMAPMLVMCCVPIALFKRFIIKDLTYNMHTQIQLHLLRLPWTIILLAGTCMGIRSTYIILIPVFFQTCAFMIIHLTCSQYTARVWQITYFIFTIIPVMFLIYIVILVTPTATTAFSNLGENPEPIIAFIYCFFTLLIASIYGPLITILQKSYIILSVGMGMFLIFCILLFTPITFPYSGSPNFSSPQKFLCYYKNEIIRNEWNHIYGRHKEITCDGDYNTNKTISKYIKEPEFDQDTDLIPLSKSVKLHLDSKLRLNPSVIHYNFTVEGPSRMFIQTTILNDAVFKSAKIYMGNTEVILKSNKTYYNMRYNRGKSALPLHIVFKIHSSNQQYPKLQFQLTALYEYNSNNFSIPYYDKYLKLFPAWTNVDTKLMLTDTWSFN